MKTKNFVVIIFFVLLLIVGCSTSTKVLDDDSTCISPLGPLTQPLRKLDCWVRRNLW